jgi:hypothetical protein
MKYQLKKYLNEVFALHVFKIHYRLLPQRESEYFLNEWMTDKIHSINRLMPTIT